MLICSSCGAENAEGTKFCGKCGTPVAAASVETAPKADEPAQAITPPPAAPTVEPAADAKSVEPAADAVDVNTAEAVETAETTDDKAAKPAKAKSTSLLKKILLIALPSFVVVVGIIITATVLLSMTPYAMMDDMLILKKSERVIVVNNAGKTQEIDGTLIDYEISMDGKIAAICVSGKNYESGQKGGALYYVCASGKPAKVADYVEDFRLSDTGKGIVFWRNLLEDEHIADLYHFDGKKSTRIGEDVPYDEGGYAVISPDGQSVFFIGESTLKDVEVDEYSTKQVWETVAFTVINGGTAEQFSNDVIPVAMSNCTKNKGYLYFIKKSDDEADTFRVGTMSGDTTKLAELTYSQFQGAHFNADYSQVVFEDEWRTFISVNGGERAQISSNKVNYFVVPNYAQIRLLDTVAFMSGGNNTAVYGFKDFKGKVFETNDGGTRLLSNNLESDQLSSLTNAKMTADGKRLYFLRDGAIRTVSAVSTRGDEFSVATGISSFAVGKKGVFGVDYYGDLRLYAPREDNTGKRVASSVNQSGLFTTGKGVAYFTMSDGSDTIRYAKKAKLVGSASKTGASNVSGMMVGNSNVYYFSSSTYGEFELYRNSGSGKFRNLQKSVTDVRCTLWINEHVYGRNW